MFTLVVLVSCDLNQNMMYVLADDSLKSCCKIELKLKWNYNSRLIPSSLKVASITIRYYFILKLLKYRTFFFILHERNYINMAVYAGADLGGGQGGQSPPSKIFYLYVNTTINSMKISFNDV